MEAVGNGLRAGGRKALYHDGFEHHVRERRERHDFLQTQEPFVPLLRVISGVPVQIHAAQKFTKKLTSTCAKIRSITLTARY